MDNQFIRDQMLAQLYPDMFASVYPFMQGAQNIVGRYGTNRKRTDYGS